MDNHFYSRTYGLVALVTITFSAVGCMSTSALNNSMESLGLSKPKSASEQRMLEIARTYEEHGNKENAKRLYAQVLNQNVSAENRKIVEERLASLENNEPAVRPGYPGNTPGNTQRQNVLVKASPKKQTSGVPVEFQKSTVKPEIAHVNGSEEQGASEKTAAVIAALAEADQVAAHAEPEIALRTMEKSQTDSDLGELLASGQSSEHREVQKIELPEPAEMSLANAGPSRAEETEEAGEAEKAEEQVQPAPPAESCDFTEVAEVSPAPAPFPVIASKSPATADEGDEVEDEAEIALLSDSTPQSKWRATKPAPTERSLETAAVKSTPEVPAIQDIEASTETKASAKQGEGGFWRSTHSDIMPEDEEASSHEADWCPTQELFPPDGEYRREMLPAGCEEEENAASQQFQAERENCELLSYIFEQGNAPVLSDEVQEEIKQYLSHEDQMVSLLSAETLLKHRIMHEQISEVVVQSLYSSDEAVRLVAVHVLSPNDKLALEYAPDLLLAKTTDDTTVVRRLAILELGGIPHPSNLVIHQLKQLVIGDEPDQIQRAAEISLRCIAENLSKTSQLAATR